MRRLGPAFLVGGVVAVAIAAAIDALRVEKRPRAAPAPAEEARSAASLLGEQGIGGILYVVVRKSGGCRLTVLRLPALERAGSGAPTPCRAEAGAGETVALGEPCPATRVELRSGDGVLLDRPLTGCAPAWRPNGELTFVSNGRVVAADFRCAPPGVGPCLREFLDRADLAQLRSAARLPQHGRYVVREIAWQEENRLVALVRWQGRFVTGFPVVFTGDRLVPPEGLGAPGEASGLFVDPATGEIIARLTSGDSGAERFFAWSRDAEAIGERTHVFGSNRAYTRSPGGGWVATAGPEGVHVFSSTEEGRPSNPVLIPLRGVVDVAWG